MHDKITKQKTLLAGKSIYEQQNYQIHKTNSLLTRKSINCGWQNH